MNTSSIKRDLLESLKDREFRQAFNLENVYATICFQLRALREQRGLSQAGLGRTAKMAQERISILEDPNADTKPTLNTLLRLADGLDVGLDVRFVPFSTVLDRSVHTDIKGLEVPNFTEELPSLEREINHDLRREQIVATLAQRNSNLISGEKFDEIRRVVNNRELPPTGSPSITIATPTATGARPPATGAQQTVAPNQQLVFGFGTPFVTASRTARGRSALPWSRRGMRHLSSKQSWSRKRA
ncbi:MAG TPA: helix-turn-helix transcriptional regulator [Terriglobales bacterium]